jgi:uncharacterized membrane protein
MSAPLVPGMLLGGLVIAVMGVFSTVYLEEKNPSVKTVSRDFIIGAIMLAFILQVLPESSTSLIQAIIASIPFSLSVPSLQGGAVQDDMEVKVGVPNF